MIAVIQPIAQTPSLFRQFLSTCNSNLGKAKLQSMGFYFRSEVFQITTVVALHEFSWTNQHIITNNLDGVLREISSAYNRLACPQIERPAVHRTG